MAIPRFILLSVVALTYCGSSVAWADDEAAERDFTLKVLPVLKARCFACHGEGDKGPRGGLDVRSRDALLKGGDSGEPSLKPGKPDESLVYKAVRWDDLEMPPKENDRPSCWRTPSCACWYCSLKAFSRANRRSPCAQHCAC